MADPEGVSEFLEELEEEEKIIDLDKSWHGIHFLLTGSAEEGEEPLCYLIKGGEEIGCGDEDGYPGYLLEDYEWLRSFVEQMKNENKGAIIYFM